MTTKGAILKAIRQHCLDCCNGSIKEVELCEVGNNPTSSIGRCVLYPYRFGSDPKPSKKGFALKTPRVADVILTNNAVLGG